MKNVWVGLAIIVASLAGYRIVSQYREESRDFR